MIELVLPSGRFASIREATAMDLIRSYHENALLMNMLLASHLVTIDGATLPINEWGEMPLSDYVPIMAAVAKVTGDAVKNTKGIA